MNTWDNFFGNPIIGSYLTEADEMEGSVEEPQEPNGDIEQLKSDYSQGIIDQSDLANMYKTGKLTREDIEIIVTPDQDPSGEGEEQAPGEEGELSEEELLAQQVDQTNDLFVKFSIYDKINELTDKLNYFKDNFEDIQSDMYERVLQLREFLNILSNLVFNIETAVAYQMYGGILLQLTTLFEDYNNLSKNIKAKEDAEEDAGIAPDLKDEVEAWTDNNQSHLMREEPNDVNDSVDQQMIKKDN